MNALFAIVGLGFVLGMRHATDPDHVVAVTAIVSCERKLGAAARVGLIWGAGHCVTVSLMGGAIVFFRLAISPRVALSMELAVAGALLLLGVSTLKNFLAGKPALANRVVHSHLHSHGPTVHRHAHAHADRLGAVTHGYPTAAHDHGLRAEERIGSMGRWSAVKAFTLGLIHGLAGSAAIALLVLGAVPEPAWALAYLLVFNVGTLTGMALVTSTIGIPFVIAGPRLLRVHRALGLGAGALSLGFGLAVAYRISVTGGLFGLIPRWLAH